MIEDFCKQADCYADTGCIFGELNPNDCEHQAKGEDPETPSALPDGDVIVPWHGSSLGLTELQFVASRQRPRVIGIVGPHNAGKTTFITSVYLMLFHGTRIPNKSFAGSFTLRGWESLANNLRYPTGAEPMFPRHTPVTEDRVPGLLHIAFRNATRRLEDVLFTDAPGEWFSNWAKDRNADNAAGARWIARHANAFLFFIDSEELAGANRGNARNLITSLAQRLADVIGNRQVLLLWSKDDVTVDAGMKEQIKDRLHTYFPGAPQIAVSIRNESRDGIRKVAEIILGDVQRNGACLRCELPTPSPAPFLRYCKR